MITLSHGKGRYTHMNENMWMPTYVEGVLLLKEQCSVLQFSGAVISLIPDQTCPPRLKDIDLQSCPSLWTGLFPSSADSMSESAYSVSQQDQHVAAFYGHRQRCSGGDWILPSNSDVAT